MSTLGLDPLRPSLLPSLQGALLAAEAWEGLSGERRMAAALLRWLLRVGWLGSASRAAFEVPWRGRRIDLVTLTGSGTLSAFEFKLGGTGRVFEQAIYNAGSVHRSYVVCGGPPGAAYRELARAQGLGIVVVNGAVDLVQRPLARAPRPDLSRPLRDAVRARSEDV